MTGLVPGIPTISAQHFGMAGTSPAMTEKEVRS
jgi:hypothetical protein